MEKLGIKNAESWNILICRLTRVILRFFLHIIKNVFAGFRKHKHLFHKNWKFLNLGRRGLSHTKEYFMSCGTEYGGNNLQVG